MMKFKKSKLELLKELRELVSREIGDSRMNIYMEQEVAEFLVEVTNKRRSRRLKSVRRELDNWIDELKNVERKL